MKFSSLLTSACLIALAQPTAAQINNDRGRIVGDGQLVTQQRTVGRFNKLSVDYAVSVRITEGDPALAELEAEGNAAPARRNAPRGYVPCSSGGRATCATHDSPGIGSGSGSRYCR